MSNEASALPLPKLAVCNLEERNDSKVEEEREVSVVRAVSRLNTNDLEVSQVNELLGPSPNALQDEHELDVFNRVRSDD